VAYYRVKCTSAKAICWVCAKVAISLFTRYANISQETGNNNNIR